MGTGAQPSLIAETFLPERWTIHRQAAGKMHLCTASKDLIDDIGKIDVHVRIGDYLTKATFHIVDELAINILFGTSFLDENILGMLSQSKKWNHVTLSQFQ